VTTLSFAERVTREGFGRSDAWVKLEPLRRQPSQPTEEVLGTLLDLRMRILGGQEKGSIDLDDVDDYGSGDAALADEVAEAHDAIWDV